MKSKILILTIIIACISCTNKQQKYEDEGHVYISNARKALSKGDYKKAMFYIESLRTECPRALNAREEGILVMDSAQMYEARVQLDSMSKVVEAFRLVADSTSPADRQKLFNNDILLDEAVAKVMFYEKKIEHDKNKKN